MNDITAMVKNQINSNVVSKIQGHRINKHVVISKLLI